MADRQTILKQVLKQHEQTVKAAQQENKKQGLRGQVGVDKQPHRYDKTLVDKTWPKVTGYKNIAVCSGSPGIYKQLSPMRLGPIAHNEDVGDGLATNIENLWQFSKVFSDDVDEQGDPLPAWYERRRQGYLDPKAHRHVKKGRVLYFVWNGERLSFVEARKKIYCPIYAQYVVQTEAYRKLLALLEEGYNLQILGYDGYNFITEGKTATECLNDLSRPFGHELVLTCLLRGERPWEE